ncbi:centromere protein B, putative [Ixodes scapularis]|uniref:Centromere protein B, putative n=1 Tax=Ixodes scapularis TaxID=6945 RepID=B7P237_IXOSC|nr:centromere protein B, putative [Ixodes scapularis]|eukprot:XP_002401414.1 centromere protein B, putative [Ixodes scapularis]
MSRDLFAEWLVEFDRDMARKNRKVLLVLDNCAAHHVQLSLSAVTVLFLPPNATCKIQPLDMGIIHAFKVCYRRRVIQRLLIAIDRPDAAMPVRISLLAAVEMLKAAWMELTAECIADCFRKAGFMGPGTEDAIDHPQEGRSHEDLWQRVVDTQLAGPDVAWDDFVSADDDADIAEPCTDEAIVREVRALPDCPETDEDDDEDAALPPVAALCESIRELLGLLVDEPTLKGFGYPDKPVDELLEAVIRRCGHSPASPDDYGYMDRLRENSKLLFTVVIDDNAVKTLLNNQTVDEVILHVLRLANRVVNVQIKKGRMHLSFYGFFFSSFS